MKDLNLKSLGLTELSPREMRETDGGMLMLLIRAFFQPAVVITRAIVDHLSESGETDNSNQN